MDLKKSENNTTLKETIHNLMSEYEKYLIDMADTDQHKAALLCYWLKDYKKMLIREKQFNPSYLKKYRRGDIISVNLGFNVGSEQGGLHFAVVLEDNPRKSETITIMPLKSRKNSREEQEYEIDLNGEIVHQFSQKINNKFIENKATFEELDQLKRSYQLLINELTEKVTALKAEIPIKIKELTSSPIDEFNTKKDLIEKDFDSQISELSNQSKIAFKKKQEIALQQQKIQKELDVINKYIKQLGKMKKGSIGLIKQITTISKMRIVNPISDKDTLAGIRLSDEFLSKIDTKIKQIYTKE